MNDEVIRYLFDEHRISAKAFRNIEKARGICEMRAAEFTYAEIGKEFNISPSGAREYVVRAMRFYRHYKEKDKRKEKIENTGKMTNEEAIYYMPYHEMVDIRAFVRNHKWEDIPESIKEHLPEWEEFLYDCVIADIDDFPTADVQEVEHGKWEQVQATSPKYVCTNCRHLLNNKSFKYCPNCGAKMERNERK